MSNKIKNSNITDGTIADAKLAADVKTNIVDSGTGGLKLPAGTTAQRTANTGNIRFNTSTNAAEYYDGTTWKSIDIAPIISSIDISEVDSQAGGDQTVVITGSNFSSGSTVTFVGQSANFNASSTTFDSTTQITAVAPKSSFLNAQEPYSVKVTSATNLSSTLSDVINVDSAPSFTTSAGSLGTFVEETSISTAVVATDPDSDAITYSVQSGSLPGGLSLTAGTGAISGTASAISSDTTSNFTIRATANSKTSDRAFSMVVKNNAMTASLPDTTYAWYNFNGQNANDSSGNSRNATATNVTYTTTDQIGSAFSYHALYNDSGGSYIQTPFTRGSTTGFSVAMWFKTDSTGRYFVGDVGGAYNIAFAAYMSGAAQITAVVDGSGGPTYSTNWSTSSYVTNMADDNWHHVVIAQHDYEWNAYIDGNHLGTNASTMIKRNGVNNLKVGSYSGDGGTNWKGELEDVRFFTKKLSSSEVTTLYNATNGLAGI